MKYNLYSPYILIIYHFNIKQNLKNKNKSVTVAKNALMLCMVSSKSTCHLSGLTATLQLGVHK